MVGCGEISAVHLDAILAASASDVVGPVQLVAVCDVDRERSAAVAASAGCEAFTDSTALLDKVEPTVVHVCTPHHRHADLAVQCLDRNVSVLLEKPIAHTVEAAELVAAAAERSNGILGVCLQNRYNENALRLREFLDTGALGAVQGGRASMCWFRDADYYTRAPWRSRWATAGGGVLMTQAIHSVDLLQWYLGPVTEVRGIATAVALDGVIEVEDTAVMRMSHHSDDGRAISSILNATNTYVENAPVSIEIVTDRAHARLVSDLTVTHADGRVDVYDAAVAASGEKAYWGNSHGTLIEDFYRHVRTGTPFWIGAAVGLESLRAIQSVYDQSPGLLR